MIPFTPSSQTATSETARVTYVSPRVSAYRANVHGLRRSRVSDMGMSTMFVK